VAKLRIGPVSMVLSTYIASHTPYRTPMPTDYQLVRLRTEEVHNENSAHLGLSTVKGLRTDS
jgi:hypothetical protein